MAGVREKAGTAWMLLPFGGGAKMMVPQRMPEPGVSLPSDSQWPKRGPVDAQPSLRALEETTHESTVCQGWLLSSPPSSLS